MRLADFIEQNSVEIIARAVAFASTQAPSGVELSDKELRNHLPQILSAVAGDLRTTQTSRQQQVKSEGRAPSRVGPESAASYHGRTRAIAGFGINQMVAEYRALRASVLRLWADQEAFSGESIEDIVRFNEAIDQAVAESLAEYSAEVESWREIFLGALGHDLRGPLTAVVYTADILVEKTRGTPLARQAERVLTGGLRMNKLLNDLLEYSKSKLGAAMEIHRAHSDLGLLIGEEVDLVRAAIPGTAFRYERSGNADGYFDDSRLREAVHNLCTNAAKYGEPDTEVCVEVAGEDDQVTITVSNQGAPLTDAALQSLFDPLRRGPKDASKDEHMSLGLGLYLVREIAIAHGGTVTASSADGVTKFAISLPRS